MIGRGLVFKLALLAVVFSCQQPKPNLIYNSTTHLSKATHHAVFVFLAADCPLCKNYRPLIRRLESDLSQLEGWQLVTVRIDNIDTASFSGNEFVDKEKKLVKLFHAKVTPEVFVVDSNSQILYSGALDNYSYETGRHRNAANRHYLLDAIHSIQENEKIQMGHVDPVGCFIEP